MQRTAIIYVSLGNAASKRRYMFGFVFYFYICNEIRLYNLCNCFARFIKQEREDLLVVNTIQVHIVRMYAWLE